MRSFLKLAVSGAVLCSAITAAQADNTPAVPASLAQALKAYAQPYLKTITQGREVHLYNWMDRTGDLFGGADPDKTNHSFFLNPFENSVRGVLGFIEGQYPDASGSGTAIAGDGIYAAIDPLATVNPYGGSSPNSWVLSQFVLVGGMRFLETGGNDPGFSTASISISEAPFSCTANTLLDVFDNARGSPGCQAIRNSIRSSLGFDAIRYSYPGGVAFPNCPNRNTSDAFVLFGDNATNWPRWVSFTAPLPSNTPNDQQYGNRLLIQGMFQLASQASNYVSSTWLDQVQSASGVIDYLPWPALRGKAVVDASRSDSVQAWMSKHIMGCGSAGQYPEDN